jgi:hypothetical protein
MSRQAHKSGRAHRRRLGRRESAALAIATVQAQSKRKPRWLLSGAIRNRAKVANRYGAVRNRKYMAAERSLARTFREIWIEYPTHIATEPMRTLFDVGEKVHAISARLVPGGALTPERQWPNCASSSGATRSKPSNGLDLSSADRICSGANMLHKCGSPTGVTRVAAPTACPGRRPMCSTAITERSETARMFERGRDCQQL